MKKLSMLLAASSLLTAAHTASAEEHKHHNHAHHEQANHNHNGAVPLGVSGAHIHEKGEWMTSYKYMNMKMDGLREGDSNVSLSEFPYNPPPAGPAGTFVVAPLQMNMEMHMFGAMGGITDRLTAMVMVPYTFMSMDHRAANGTLFTTETEGLGDVKLSSTYDLWTKEEHNVLLNAGLSLPTGDINSTDFTPAGGNNTQLPYPMQLGSGTYDLLPGITYLYTPQGALSYGAQAKAVMRLGRNDRDYSLGDQFTFDAWAGYDMEEFGTATARLHFFGEANIDGEDSALNQDLITTARTDFQASQRIDLNLGYAYELGSNRFLVEGGLPLYEKVDGIQLEHDYSFSLAWQLTF